MKIQTMFSYLFQNQIENSIDKQFLNQIIPFDKEIAVLGSGSTIVKLNTNLLQNKYKIGFNWWIYNDIVPDLYVMEINLKNLNDFKLWCNLLDLKKNEYKDVIFLFKDSENTNGIYYEILNKYFPNELVRNSYFTIDKHIIGKSLIQLKISYLLISIFYKNNFKKFRGTLSYILDFCPKNSIVHLFGIDLDKREHFWNNKNFKSSNNFKKLNNSLYDGSHLHKTVDKKYGNLTIDLFLKFLILKKKHIIKHHNPVTVNFSSKQ